MDDKEKLRQWRAYLKKKESEGLSLDRIRHHLVFDRHYDPRAVEAILKDYRKSREILTIAAEISVVILLAMLLFLIKPSSIGLLVSPLQDTDPQELENGVDVLFIDNSNPGCDDSYSREQALSSLTPWCTLSALDKLQGGDTLYIREGEYNGGYSVFSGSFDSNVTISAYPGDSPNITRYIDSYAQVPNALWTDLGNGLWKTTLDFSDTNYPRVYFRNTSKFFTWKTEASFLSSGYPASAWYDDGTKELYLKFSDQTDPNQVPIHIANQYTPLRIESNSVSADTYITISGLTFKYSIIGVDIRDQSNVVVEDCSFLGGHEGIKVNNYNSHENLIFRYNYLDGKQNPVWYERDMKTEATEETSGILVENHAGPVIAYNNTFTHWHGGLTLATESQDECDGSEVYNNVFRKGRGSQIEIEKYCSNSVWHHNKVIDSEMGVSFAPAQGVGCEFHHNIIVVPGTIRYSSTTTYNSYAIKAQYRVADSLPVSGWDIHHNTFYAYGRALNGMEDGTFEDTNFTDNIFFADQEYVLLRSGESIDGVFYDHNLYYSPPGGYNIFARWNDDSDTTQFSSLADALSSDNWDGTWDLNSAEADPEFNDASSFDMRPQEGSPACSMSSSGSYVGALTCMGAVCGDGVVEGEEVCDDGEDNGDYGYCRSDCTGLGSHCGDGALDGDESCELPGTSDDDDCTQSTSDCSGLKKGTRDAFGDCDASCGCVYDSFSYSCVAGECGAECSVDADCNDSDESTADTCLENCTCQYTDISGCGNGVIDEGESCELPGDIDDEYCNQTTETCNGTLLGTRDAFGDCDASCGCVYDSFSYSCVAGECGAECSVDADCNDSDEFTADTCLENCTCQYTDISGCGNGVIDEGESCELPGDIDDEYCNQTTETCNGILLGTRDGYGDCNSICGCDYNEFTYSCVPGECGAECSVDADCDDGDGNTTDKCMDCLCEHEALDHCGDANCTEDCSSCPQDCGYCSITSCTLANKTWQEDFNLQAAFNLTGCFTDPNGLSMNYSVSGNTNITINITDGIASLEPDQDWNGEETVTFTADCTHDRQGSASAVLTVLSVADCNDSVCEEGEDFYSCPEDCAACMLDDLNWEEDSVVQEAYNLTQCFGMNSGFNATGNRSIRVNITDGIVYLSAPADWYGSETVYFWVNQSFRSNNVTLQVTGTADCGDGNCDTGEDCSSCPEDCGTCRSSGGGGGGGSISSIQTVDISSDFEVREYRTVRLDLNSTVVNLRVVGSDEGHAELTIGNDEFSLEVGEQIEFQAGEKNYTLELLGIQGSTAGMRIQEIVRQPAEPVMENETQEKNETQLSTQNESKPAPKQPTAEEPASIERPSKAGETADSKGFFFLVIMALGIIILSAKATMKLSDMRFEHKEAQKEAAHKPKPHKKQAKRKRSKKS